MTPWPDCLGCMAPDKQCSACARPKAMLPSAKEKRRKRKAAPKPREDSRKDAYIVEPWDDQPQGGLL